MEERETIAREIHNSVGHTITSAIVVLDAAEAIYDIDPKKAKEHMLAASNRMQESLFFIRKAVRTETSDEFHISFTQLLSHMKQCINQFKSNTGIVCKDNFDAISHSLLQKQIDSGDASFLYEAVQECLTNSLKHGQSTAIIVLFIAQSNSFTLKIQDNGSGFVSQTKSEQTRAYEKGFGLKAIGKYVTQANGSFSYDGSDGFCVSITLPIHSTYKDTVNLTNPVTKGVQHETNH